MSSVDEVIKMTLEGIYGEAVLRDLHEIIRLYDYYDGAGQDWAVAQNLDYEPTKKRTNFIKKIIKEQARFLFGKTPEINILGEEKEQIQKLQTFLNGVLDENLFCEKLIKAARDCFIGKRVAIKVGVDERGKIMFSFRNAMEFVYETIDDDCNKLKTVVFFYSKNDESSWEKQRIWRQKYLMDNGRCLLWEGVYDGHGQAVEETISGVDTGLSTIPVKIIINDGLGGDLLGESDVEPLIELQNVYNRLTSDDVDALKFNMFPQTVAVDAMEKSLSEMVIAPGALVDLQTETTAGEGRQAKMSKLESSFGYNDRLENTLNRVKTEMHELLGVPLVTPSELGGFMTSGKAMKALYWQLVTRCEEKFTTWKPALAWLAQTIIELGVHNKLLEDAELSAYNIFVDNLYPLMEDELEEKTFDLELVKNELLSRQSYIKKWNKERENGFADLEIAQIEIERG